MALDGVAGGPCWQQQTQATSLGTLRANFWLRPDSLTNGGVTKSWTIYSAHHPGDGVAVLRLDAHHLVGGAVRLRLSCRRDDGTYALSTLLTMSNTMPGPERHVEVEWTAGAGTGFCRLTRLGGGFPSVEVLGLDNDTLSVIRTRLGAVVGLDAGESGAYCLDELVEFR